MWAPTALDTAGISYLYSVKVGHEEFGDESQGRQQTHSELFIYFIVTRFWYVKYSGFLL